MLRVLLFFAAGIVLGGRWVLPSWFLAAAFLLTGLSALLLRSQLCAAALLTVAGAGAANLRAVPVGVPREVPVLLRVDIEGMPLRSGERCRADGRIVAWRDPLRGRWLEGGCRVVVRCDTLLGPVPGEQLICRARVRPFRDTGRGYGALMTRRGYAGVLYLGERDVLERTPPPRRGLHLRAVERLRRLPVGAAAGALLPAMCAGDRSGIAPSLREVYSRSGFSHLLALSGLHTGVLFVLVNALFWWLPLLGRGAWVRNAAVAGCVWLFVAAADFPVSAVRAAVMCTLLQCSRAFGSEYTALNTLGVAATGMLLWNPAWISEPGFRLSFVAAGAICAWGVPLCRRCSTGIRWIDFPLRAWLVGLVAAVAAAPLVAHHFGILPLAGVLAGPAAVLLSGVVVACGVVWMALPVDAAGPLLGSAAELAARGIDLLAHWTASLRWGAVAWSPSGEVTAAIYLLFALLTLAAWCSEPKKSVLLPHDHR